MRYHPLVEKHNTREGYLVTKFSDAMLINLLDTVCYITRWYALQNSEDIHVIIDMNDDGSYGAYMMWSEAEPK